MKIIGFSVTMSHFRLRPEVVVEEWFTPHPTRNPPLTDENMRKYTLKISISCFITDKVIKPEIGKKTKDPYFTWNDRPFDPNIKNLK